MNSVLSVSGSFKQPLVILSGQNTQRTSISGSSDQSKNIKSEYRLLVKKKQLNECKVCRFIMKTEFILSANISFLKQFPSLSIHLTPRSSTKHRDRRFPIKISDQKSNNKYVFRYELIDPLCYANTETAKTKYIINFMLSIN